MSLLELFQCFKSNGHNFEVNIFSKFLNVNNWVLWVYFFCWSGSIFIFRLTVLMLVWCEGFFQTKSALSSRCSNANMPESTPERPGRSQSGRFSAGTLGNLHESYLTCLCLSGRIWQHLVEIVKTGKVSVIITTHYIEEARQANVVRRPTRARRTSHAWARSLCRQTDRAPH